MEFLIFIILGGLFSYSIASCAANNPRPFMKLINDISSTITFLACTFFIIIAIFGIYLMATNFNHMLFMGADFSPHETIWQILYWGIFAPMPLAGIYCGRRLWALVRGKTEPMFTESEIDQTEKAVHKDK